MYLIYLYSGLSQVSKGIQKVIEKIKPAKIPIPPKDGVAWVWDRLSPGSSQRFFSIAILIIDGIAKKEMMKAVIKLDII